MALIDKLTAIGNAIRSKTGTTATMTLDEMATAINELIKLDVEKDGYSYNQINPTLLEYLNEAYSTYTDSNYSTTSVVSKYNDGTKNYDDPTGKEIKITKDSKIYFDNLNDSFFSWNDTASSGTYTAYNLIPYNTYKYSIKDGDTIIDSGILTATGDIRQIYAPSADNCRDLGGHNTAYGNRIKYGILYRGGDVRGETAFTNIMTNTCKIQHEIDLQEENSTNSSNTSMFGNGVTYERISMNGDLSYRQHIDQSLENYTIVAQVMKKVMEYAIKKEPVYIHCSLGRDRTGVVCYMLQGLLGMSITECGIDYELTNITGYLWNQVSIAQHTNGRRMFTSFHDYFKTINSEFYKAVNQWCLNAGIEQSLIDKFRNAMLKGEFSYSTEVIDEPETPTATYTNVLATATDADGNVFNNNGYIDGYYCSSANGFGYTADSGYWTSGFMQVTDGSPIYIKGWTWEKASHSRFYHYNASNNIVWHTPLSGTGNDTTIGTSWEVEVLNADTNYVKLTPTSAAMTDINQSSVTKWRISMPGTGNGVIITIGEEIS